MVSKDELKDLDLEKVDGGQGKKEPVKKKSTDASKKMEKCPRCGNDKFKNVVCPSCGYFPVD